jgi:hypothetical protein
MKANKQPLLSGLFALLFVAFCSSFAAHAAMGLTQPDKAESTVIYADMEWKGHISNQKERLVKVIAGKEEWDALWRRAFDQQAPDIDFYNYAVACVFLGHNADWLYSIGFDKPYVRGDITVIPYGLHKIVLELMGPFKASGQYHMKVYKKSRGVELILEDSAESFRKMRGR